MQIKEVDVEKTEIFSIGRQYSHNVLVIHFVNLPNLKNKYIYYKIDDIEEEIPLVSDLFIVSRPLTMHSGKVKAQIIVRDEANETIDLTKNFTMIIKASNYSGIGEDENYPDDLNVKNYFVKIDEKVNSFEELANLVQTKLDNGEFIGAQGPKGDPGDVTEEYRNLAMQIAQNASDAQTSATNAQTSASNAQRILNDTKEFANQTKSEMNQIKNDTELLKNEANTSAVNAKASENKAKEYADNLQASTDDISKLKEDKITKPSEPPTTGKILRVKSVNEDGTFVCEWADCGGSNLDVKVNGKSIVEKGIAEIPMMSFEKSGLIQFKEGYGLQNIGNYLLVKGATETEITNRHGSRTPIGANSIDHVVKSAMCDGKGATWKDVERLACLLRMGCTVDEKGFVKWTTQEVTE